MRFEPVYYSDKVRQASHGDAFEKDKLNVINPYGRAGIVTLWSKPGDVWANLQKNYPQLFTSESPLVAITSLYGNGLPQMLANLAHNPQIEYLAITGTDTKVVPSSEYLMNFLRLGIDAPSEPGKLGKIKGTQYSIDPQLDPSLFKHLKVERFPKENLENIVAFISQNPTYQTIEESRRRIQLIEPVFDDFPSDVTNHAIYAATPLKAWMDVMYHLNRFGENIQLAKGKRRSLFNLDVHIENPAPEDPALLKQFNFSWDELRSYRESMLQSKIPEGGTYNYPNRIMEHFGVNALENVISRLKADKLDRRGFITTWDNKNDIISPGSDSSVPCLTNLYFFAHNEKLLLTADFRTHNAVSAWLLNLYGLRSLQEHVAQEIGMTSGKINVKSRYIGIDPDDGKTNAALDLVAKHRKIPIDVNDPRGYFVIDSQSGIITADHYSPKGEKLKSYEGKTALDIKDQLRQDSVIVDPDHATWLGMKLGAHHFKIHGEMPE